MLNEFKVYIPETIEEACLLKRDGAIVLAGGTDVIIGMHGGKQRPDALVDIKGLKELQGFSFDNNGGDIGALTLHHDIENSTYVEKVYTALQTGCASVGAHQTRQRGTIGGNICNAAPSADSAGPLLVFDTQCVITGLSGERTVPLCDFYTGAKKTVLQEDEILTRLLIRHPAPHSGSAYIKYGRRNAMDLALMGVSVYLELDDGNIRDVRIALTTMAPTPKRAYITEELIKGRYLNDNLIAEAGKSASAESKPRTSWRASSELRYALVEEITQRAIRAAAKLAIG